MSRLRINIDVFGGIAHLRDADWHSEDGSDCPISSEQLEVYIRDIEDSVERHCSKSLTSNIKINRI